MEFLNELYSGASPFDTGRLIVCLSAVWFLMAFIVRRRSAISVAVDCICGTIFFLVGGYGLIIGFAAADLKQKIETVAVPVVILIVILFIILTANGFWQDIFTKDNHAEDEDEYEENDDDY